MLRAKWLTVLGNLTTLCFLASLAFGQSPVLGERSLAPHWIWHRDTCGELSLKLSEKDECILERAFQVDQRVKAATLRLAADFCHARVEINGRPVASVEPYSPTIDVDVGATLRSGDNRVVIAAEAVGGPAAIAISLAIVTVDGRRSDIVTDDKWRVSRKGKENRGAVSLGPVDPSLFGLGRRPATIDPFDNYEQWRRAPGTP